MKDAFQNFYIEIKKLLDNSEKPEILQKDLCSENKLNCSDFPELSQKEGGIFESFNCGFFKNDLNMT